MSNDQTPQEAAVRFIVDQIDLLLVRFEQLGRQIRDTVARIVGTTVADAVSEAIRLAMRMIPQRRPAPSRRGNWQYDESYDPYEDDDFDQRYRGDRDADMPSSRSTQDWGLVSRIVCFATRTLLRLKSWRIGHWLPLGGVAALEYLVLAPPNEVVR